jgi:hypothetical protein
MRRACAALVVVLPLLAACIPVPATIVQVMGIATSTPTLGPSSLSDTPTVPPTPTPPSPTAETPRRVASPLVPTVGGTATLVRGTAGTPATAAARATASALYYRLDVRRTWTQPGAGGDTTYFLDVAVCNETQAARDIRLAALTIIVRPRGRPGAVGYAMKPEPAPGDGFAATSIVSPGACARGVVTATPPRTEVPDTLWYRSGDGREAAEPVRLTFPD